MTKEALTLALEAAELGLDYAKSEQFENSQRYKGYEHLAPDDVYCVGVFEKAITAIKEALSSPNGEAQPEQRNASEHLEPVAWYSVEGETRRYGVGIVECAYAIGRDEVVHVVTHESVKDVAMKHLPIQRTAAEGEDTRRAWVDLTDEQMWNAYTGGSDIINLDYAKSIVALFKEKNT